MKHRDENEPAHHHTLLECIQSHNNLRLPVLQLQVCRHLYYITAELGAFKFAEYHLKIVQIKCMGLESYIVTLKVHNDHCSVNQVKVKQAHNDSELLANQKNVEAAFLSAFH